jgi:PAS domain S-box-containing protein
MNPPAEALTGVKSDGAMGKPIGEVMELLDAPDGLPVLRALSARQMVPAEEARLVNKVSGATFAINDSAAPVVDEQEMLGAVMVFRDITEQKQLQRQVELSDRLASLGTLAAGVAHEVNNPLAAVVSNAQFVTFQLERLCEDLAGVVDVRALLDPLADIESASTRIGRIVSDLRAFSHLDRHADVAGIDVFRCLHWALRTTAHEFRQRARVTTHLTPLPPVLANETKLGQVFINLLVNAAHAIAPGHADTNHVRISTGVSDSGDIVITISDTGCGIADDARARIFEPFFTTKAPGRGTGLGLSISHGIMRSLGGRLEVESVVNEGTTMRVVLPAATPTAAPTTSPPAPAAQVARARVLAIDDEPLVLRLVGRVLRAHEVVCVDNANQAVALLERGEHFDVVLCDLNMPTMTGVDFYEVVLARFPEVARQIAFLSGGSLTPRIDDFLKAVPNLRLQKPFDIAALEALVGALLTGRGVGQ